MINLPPWLVQSASTSDIRNDPRRTGILLIQYIFLHGRFPIQGVPVHDPKQASMWLTDTGNLTKGSNYNASDLIPTSSKKRDTYCS